MSLRLYLIIMGAATAIAWGLFGYVVLTIDPLITNWLGFALFYSALSIALIGAISLLGFVVRFILLKNELVFRSVKEAFRQSILLTILLVVSLFLLSKNLFTWLNAAALAIGLTVFEFFLVSYRKN